MKIRLDLELMGDNHSLNECRLREGKYTYLNVCKAYDTV